MGSPAKTGMHYAGTELEGPRSPFQVSVPSAGKFSSVSPQIIKAYLWICYFTHSKANCATDLWEKMQYYAIG